MLSSRIDEVDQLRNELDAQRLRILENEEKLAEKNRMLHRIIEQINQLREERNGSSRHRFYRPSGSNERNQSGEILQDRTLS